MGCRGILIYSDNSLVDPRLVAQLILQAATRLCLLVAVQPVYMHPYTAAKMAVSPGYGLTEATIANGSYTVPACPRSEIEAIPSAPHPPARNFSCSTRLRTRCYRE